MNGRIIYDITITVGVLSVSAGAWLQYGMPAGLATFGTLVLVMSVYAAERLMRPR